MFRVLSFAAIAALCVACASAQEGAVSAYTAQVRATPPAVAPAPHAGDAPTVFARSGMHFTPTDVGERIQLVDEPSRTLGVLEIHVTTLNPGQASHAPHQHPNEEVIVLQTGELEVYVNGIVERAGPGSVFVFLSNDWHSVNNVGTVPATYQVINFHPERH